MRATPIFFTFFLLFTAASIAAPISLFPGNLVTTFIEIQFLEYIIFIEAVTNGFTYGFVTWLVFFLVDKKLEKSLSITSKKISN